MIKKFQLKITFVFLGVVILSWQKAGIAQDEAKNPVPALRPAVEYDDAGARDPFESRIEAESVKSAPDEQSAKSVDAKKQEFAKLTVQAMIFGSGTPCAIINGAVVKIGSVIEEAKVSKIDKNGVTLLYQNEAYILPAPIQAQLALIKERKQGGPNEK